MSEREHLNTAKCVDEQIREEMWKNGAPFALLQRLKQEDPERWVSPDCSLAMFAYLEECAQK